MATKNTTTAPVSTPAPTVAPAAPQAQIPENLVEQAMVFEEITLPDGTKCQKGTPIDVFVKEALAAQAAQTNQKLNDLTGHMSELATAVQAVVKNQAATQQATAAVKAENDELKNLPLLYTAEKLAAATQQPQLCCPSLGKVLFGDKVGTYVAPSTLRFQAWATVGGCVVGGALLGAFIYSLCTNKDE